MIICVCNNITEAAVSKAVAMGASTMKDLRRSLGIGDGCGRCASFARSMLGAPAQESPAESFPFMELARPR